MSWIDVAKDVCIFGSTLLIVPFFLLIATLAGAHNPRVKMAVLVVEDLMPNAAPQDKQAVAATLISKWLGKFKWIVPIPIINSWIDWEVQILNAEKPVLWKLLSANDGNAKTGVQAVQSMYQSSQKPLSGS